jgi:hypothetical protein
MCAYLIVVTVYPSIFFGVMNKENKFRVFMLILLDFTLVSLDAPPNSVIIHGPYFLSQTETICSVNLVSFQVDLSSA